MSKILYLNLLAKFKKSNKTRREALARKNGYETADQYRAFLESMVESSPQPETLEELTDIVIAFDTTGSMGRYIDSVKRHVESLIPTLFQDNPNLKVSVVAFGDYCDMLGKDNFGNAYQVLDLTNNENDLIDFVRTAKDTGGGDSDEFYELVLHKIRTETSWREGSNKSILLIADAKPHYEGYTYKGWEKNIDWKDEARLLAELNIQVDTLQINRRISWYKELSRITNGVNLPFKSSDKTQDLVRATTLARGGEKTKGLFRAAKAAAMDSGDEELIATYTAYSKQIID